MRSTQRPADGQDFSVHNQGGTLWGVTIEYLVYSERDFIVFIDQDAFLWYDSADRCPNPVRGFERVRNRVGVLEAVDTEHLSRNQLMSYKRLIGDALVCALVDRNLDAANENLDKAQEYVAARSGEAARLWYVRASGMATLVVCLAWFMSWQFRDGIEHVAGGNVAPCLIGACAGGVGAFLSILLRIGKSPLDASAGRRMHRLEGLSRIGVGLMGALLAVIAFKLGLALSVLSSVSPTSWLGIAFVGMVAGVSERLVPTFIRRVEIGEVEASDSGSNTPRARTNKSRKTRG